MVEGCCELGTGGGKEGLLDAEERRSHLQAYAWESYIVPNDPSGLGNCQGPFHCATVAMDSEKYQPSDTLVKDQEIGETDVIIDKVAERSYGSLFRFCLCSMRASRCSVLAYMPVVG